MNNKILMYACIFVGAILAQSPLETAPRSRWQLQREETDRRHGAWEAADQRVTECLKSAGCDDLRTELKGARSALIDYMKQREALLGEMLRNNPEARTSQTPDLQSPRQAVEQTMARDQQKATQLQSSYVRLRAKGAVDPLLDLEVSTWQEDSQKLRDLYAINNSLLEEMRSELETLPVPARLTLESTVDWVARMQKGGRNWVESQMSIYSILHSGWTPSNAEVSGKAKAASKANPASKNDGPGTKTAPAAEVHP